MERRCKSTHPILNWHFQNDERSSSKEKKCKRSDTFKQMRRRISSSFGKLNVLKDDWQKGSTKENTNEKRCYSSTAIHEVMNYSIKTPTKSQNSISGSISFFQRAFCVHSQKESSDDGLHNSQVGIFKNLLKKPSSIKRHRSLGNVNTLTAANNENDGIEIRNANNISHNLSTKQSKKILESQQKQGPAAKITAKIRSRRGNSSKSSTMKGTNEIKFTFEGRPHSISRTNDYDSRTNSIVETAVQLAVSGYRQNSKDPMSKSLVLSRPRSEGHCFENLMTGSIADGAKRDFTQHKAWPNRKVTSAKEFPSNSPKFFGPSYNLFGKSDSYQKLDMLGEGSYATVFKGYSNLTKQTVALKEIRINPEEGVPFTAIREASLLKNLRHANIVILHDIVHAKDTLTFVFEFVHSDLSKYIERHPHGIKTHNIKLFLFQLLRGLGFCHDRHILHRDLKPQNLLISEIGELKLADFGLARAKSVPSRTYSNEVVTLWYRPPDVLLGSTNYNAALDMWGVGCIFVEMIGGSAIFPGLKDTDDQLEKIFKVMGSPNETVWPGVSSLPNYQYFMETRGGQIHKGRPLHRIVQRLFTIPHAESLSLAFLQIRPELRVLSKAALNHPYFEDLPRSLMHLSDNLTIFSVPGVKLMPESPLQLTAFSNFEERYYGKMINSQRISNIDQFSWDIDMYPSGISKLEWKSTAIQ